MGLEDIELSVDRQLEVRQGELSRKRKEGGGQESGLF